MSQARTSSVFAISSCAKSAGGSSSLTPDRKRQFRAHQKEDAPDGEYAKVAQSPQPASTLTLADLGLIEICIVGDRAHIGSPSLRNRRPRTALRQIRTYGSGGQFRSAR